jgi:hypothetical protein
VINILTINVESWATDLFTSVSCPFIPKSDQARKLPIINISLFKSTLYVYLHQIYELYVILLPEKCNLCWQTYYYFGKTSGSKLNKNKTTG